MPENYHNQSPPQLGRQSNKNYTKWLQAELERSLHFSLVLPTTSSHCPCALVLLFLTVTPQSPSQKWNPGLMISRAASLRAMQHSSQEKGKLQVWLHHGKTRIFFSQFKQLSAGLTTWIWKIQGFLLNLGSRRDMFTRQHFLFCFLYTHTHSPWVIIP